MAEVSAEVLTELIAASTEPQALVRIDSPDWPVVFSNPAFIALAQGRDPQHRPFPDVVTAMVGREMAREASAARGVRRGESAEALAGGPGYGPSAARVAGARDGMAAG